MLHTPTRLKQFKVKSSLLLIGMVAWEAIAHLASPAIAQISPDNTLGRERSSIHRDVQVRGERGDRIDGGALRGDNLFHSFSDFNVNDRQRVYFRNPSGIENIITRVTGNTQSDIFGTLGVLGNANLFLINPNGIILGPDAVLDIRGSLVISTADRILFEDGYAFSAVDPNAPPLLNVNSPITGLERWLPSSGHIQTTGNLRVDGDLGLTAETLDIHGHIAAEGNLSLVASEQLTATDSANIPLILSAGGHLLLQGNEALSISALAHPTSSIESRNNLTLRSDAPVVGDAVFTAGRHTSIEQIDGSLGALISPGDPVFETAGNFSVESYTGASLQILAGGSVTIPGEIVIEARGGPFNDSTVVLSDGSLLTLNGTTEPTVDIRAGTTRFFDSPASGNPTRADITIGSITNPGGIVYLTNQFRPNPDLAGDITVGIVNTSDFSGGGDLIIDSKGGITFDFIDASGGDSAAFDFEGNGLEVFGGDGGDVALLAGRDLVMPLQSFLLSYGLRGGSITLTSDTAIAQEEGPPGAGFEELSIIEAIGVGPRRSGDVRLTAPSILIGGNIFVDTYGPGRSGDLRISGHSLFASQASLNTDTFFGPGDAGDIYVDVDSIELRGATQLASNSVSFDGGDTGDVTITADTISALDGAQIGTFSFVNGDAGDVVVTANTILLSGFQSLDLTDGEYFPSAIASITQPDSVGNSGTVTVNTGTLFIYEGAKVGTSSFGVGDAGTTTVSATESIVIDGTVHVNLNTGTEVQPSSISSELFAGAVGEGGTVNITTPDLSITNGGLVSALSLGDGSAGAINIIASDSLLVDGRTSFSDLGPLNRISQISVLAGPDSTGVAGRLFIQSPSIQLSNQARITAESQGVGPGGDIVVRGEDLILEGRSLVSAETISNTGGDIALRISDIISMTGNSRISATAGTAQSGGDGGNILIDTAFLVADADSNNDITANAFDGQGGSVDITAEGVIGLTPRSRSELEQLLGTTDPEQLDPANLPTSDITAISQTDPNLNGEVIIRSPDVDPNQDVIELPSNVVDASRLIAQGCTATGTTLAQKLGSLVVTGRGGLPQAPGEPLANQDIVLGWDRAEENSPVNDVTQTRAIAPQPPSPVQITEVQALTRREDGQVILTAQSTANTYSSWNAAIQCVNPVPSVAP